MADQPKPKPPLYQVIENACFAAPQGWRAERAAEIRALADWLVPEEAEPYLNPAYGPGWAENPKWDRWHSRHQLRQLLLAEADRAEAGE